MNFVIATVAIYLCCFYAIDYFVGSIGAHDLNWLAVRVDDVELIGKVGSFKSYSVITDGDY